MNHIYLFVSIKAGRRYTAFLMFYEFVVLSVYFDHWPLQLVTFTLRYLDADEADFPVYTCTTVSRTPVFFWQRLDWIGER